jgi:hypothetical protein
LTWVRGAIGTETARDTQAREQSTAYKMSFRLQMSFRSLYAFVNLFRLSCDKSTQCLVKAQTELEGRPKLSLARHPTLYVSRPSTQVNH